MVIPSPYTILYSKFTKLHLVWFLLAHYQKQKVPNSIHIPISFFLSDVPEGTYIYIYLLVEIITLGAKCYDTISIFSFDREILNLFGFRKYFLFLFYIFNINYKNVTYFHFISCFSVFKKENTKKIIFIVSFTKSTKKKKEHKVTFQ